MSVCDTSAGIRHLLIRASAGSGKTYALTTRYLELLAAGAPPASILATTFTRAAAGEIRDRVIQRLAHAAAGGRDELTAQLGIPLRSRTAVLELVASLARDLHRLQIRTLDSFFAAVVQSFALELGIAPGRTIVDEDYAADLSQQAIARVLESSADGKLDDVLRALVQGGAHRSVVGKIDDVVRELHTVYLEAPPEAWERIAAPPRCPADEINAALAQLSAVGPIQPARLAKAIEKCRQIAQEGDWEALMYETVPKAVRTGQLTYYGKTFGDDVAAPLGVLVEHARAMILHQLRDEAIASRELLKAYDTAYREVMASAGALTFSDLTEAMQHAREVGTIDEICYRLDARLAHLLLDEFQDTSIQQWNAVEPLAREFVSDATGDHTFFCVGDVKQSIYGWRDACPEVLESIPHLLPGVLVDHLPVNRRSSPVIIDAVNTVFSSIGSNAALDRVSDAAAEWQEAYETQAAHQADLAGYFELRTSRLAADSKQQRETRLVDAVELVAELHARDSKLHIGVLARTNDVVARLLYEMSGPGLPASGRGGGPLTDAPAVNAMLDALRVADHPDDTISAFNVARSPLGVVLGLEDEKSAGERSRFGRDVRRRLARDGYRATLAAWVRGVREDCDAHEWSRLLCLLELAGEYDARATGRADDFVRLVERRAVAQTEPAAIEVMTVHQSKGLEFDAVVLPQLEFGWSDPASIFVDRDGPVGPILAVAPGVRRDLAELDPNLERMSDGHRSKIVRESLCLLYVAMTRARQGLYVIVDPSRPTKNGRSKLPSNVEGVVRDAFVGIDPVDEAATVYCDGNPDWIGSPRETGPAPLTRPRALPERVSLRAGSGRRRGLVGPPPSARSDTDLGATLRLPDVEARDRGNVLHAMFETVSWIDDGIPSAEDLADAARSAAPRRDQGWRDGLRAEFDRLLEEPEIRASLTWGDAGAGRRELHRELPFVLDREGRMVRGAIDRLVIDRDGDGRATRATIIDFKTDAITADQVERRGEHHRPQLALYREAVRELFPLDPAMIDVVVVFTAPAVAWKLPRAGR